MKQLFFTLLLTLLMSMVGANSFAHDIEATNSDGVTIYYTYKGGGALAVAGCQETSSNLVIPASVYYNGETYSVTSIGEEAFSGCSGLTSVTISEGVREIDDYAFSGCSSLTSLTIPSSVTCIGYAAFDRTAWYDNQPDGLVYAGKVAYKYKGAMPSNTSITLKEGTMGIGDYAFKDCSGLTSVTISEGVTRIGESAFYNCRGLTSLIIPSSVTSFGIYAFSGCSSLTSVTISEGVTSLPDYVYKNCSGLTSVIIPSSVTRIGDRAFYGCNSLTSVTAMMENPFNIEEYTFTNYRNATLYVPYGCKAAYNSCFPWEHFREIVELPKTIETTDISQLDNAIYIEPAEARCGSQTTLSVKMKNEVAIQTIQFDLYLPDGITIVPNEDDELVTASKERINRFNYFESSMQADGALRLLAQATSTNVPAGDGEICRIVVDIPESMEEGDYPLIIKGALMVEKNNTSHSLDPNLVQTKLTVLKYVLGDASNDGDVNAIDFNMIGNHILGQTQEGFNVKAADISGDGDVNAIDFNMVGNMILNGSTASARERTMPTDTEKGNEPQ